MKDFAVYIGITILFTLPVVWLVLTIKS